MIGYEVLKNEKWMKNICGRHGPSEMPVPTDSVIARFISTLKRFCNKEYGKNVWQYRSHDHVIRNEKDYQEIWNYIEHNAQKWEADRFYRE